MKNIYIIVFAIVCSTLAINFNASAQCTGCVVDSVGCTGPLGAVCPDTLNAAVVGNAFDEDLTLYFPSSIDTTLPIVGALSIPILEATILNVTGLPDGLTWECNTPGNGCVYDPSVSSFGCIKVCGDPCGGAGLASFNITVQFILDVSALPLPLLPDTFPLDFAVGLELQSNVPVIDITAPTQFLCTGDSILLNVTQDANFTSYAWTGGSTVDSTYAAAAGTYTVTVNDNNGCVQTASVEISRLVADAGLDTTICAGQFYQLLATGGDDFEWSPSTALSDSTVANPVLVGIATTTTYGLTVSNGVCNDSDAVTVTVDQNCGGSCAGCVKDTVGCTGNIGAVCPPDLPDADGGVAYDEDFTFFIPVTVTLDDVLAAAGIPNPGLPNAIIPIEFVEVLEVAGLPAGLNWETDQFGGGNFYYPQMLPGITNFGCVKICGTTCDTAGLYAPTLEVELTATLPPEVPFLGGQTQALPFSFDLTLEVLYDNDLAITSTIGNEIPYDGELTLVASQVGFSSYTWSTGDTTSSIVIDQPGTYCVTATEATSGCDLPACFVALVSGIEDLNLLESSLNLFPNPTDGQFQLTFDAENFQKMTLQVVDVTGKEVFIESFESGIGSNVRTIDASDFAAGLYFVKLTTEDGTVNKRVSVY